MPPKQALALLVTALAASLTTARPAPHKYGSASPAGSSRASAGPPPVGTPATSVPVVTSTTTVQVVTSEFVSAPAASGAASETSVSGVPASSAPSASTEPSSSAQGSSSTRPSSIAPSLSTSAASASGAPGSSSYWYANVDHSQDTVWQNPDTSYQVFRNVVTDFGAAGDGVTDDTAAINNAMAAGNRCGGLPDYPQCDSSTTTPAVVYFPPGKYLVSTPILMFYMTQMVGDALDPPTLLASSGFQGMAVIDSDPYIPGGNGANWFVNQNNFFRQVRNFVVDITQWNGGLNGAAIHWQVAQATSLQNIVFELSDNPATTQQGVFMDNGSGGWMSDLVFNNGNQGAFLGSQQFTVRNLTFNNCKTAIFLNWDWGWTLQGITVNGGSVGLDMSNDPTNQTVGSVVLADSTFSQVEYGVKFSYQNTSANVYPTGGTLILDNVNMSGVQTAAVVDNSNTTVLAPGMIDAWASGNGYAPTSSGGSTSNILQPTKQENAITPAKKASSLLGASGNIYGQSRPQYQNYPTSSFISAISEGAAGDGETDDTQAIIALLQKVAGTNNIAYFPHGAYLVKDTITVPPNVMMTGEIWPLIVADSASFSDESNPKPVFQIGQSGGQQGYFQMSDFIFETNGPAPGAIMIEWNLQSEQGQSGMWDTHTRIGGSAGTNLELAQCAAVNGTSSSINTQCDGVFLMFHATAPASGVYLENTWFWVADHELDGGQSQRVTIYSGRGVLIQSTGPVWLWGTASEHSILYNYQFDGVQALYSGLMQSETPYFQPFPEAPKPLTINHAYDDPTFHVCNHNNSQYCRESWGLRITNSQNILIYSTGLYSFFQDYQQTCLDSRNCQDNMIHISNSQVDMYAVNTFAAVNMIVDDRVGTVTNADNLNWWCGTLSYYFTGH